MVDMMLNFYMDMAIAVGMTAYNPNYVRTLSLIMFLSVTFVEL